MYQYKNILKRGVFIDIKNIIFSVIESLIGKLTPVLFIFLSLLIFLPEAFIVKWGLKEFYNDNKLIIGLLYLYSISYLIVLFLKFAYKGIQKQYKKIEKRKSERKQLEDLYKGLDLKKPMESADYESNSKLATKQIKKIIQDRIDNNKNEKKIELG